MPPIPVYIGTDPESWLPTQVLKHSMQCHTKREIEFIELDREALDYPRQYQLTGFSFLRWAVPYVNEYRDRVLYVDSDIVALGDIAELLDIYLDKPVGARPALSDPKVGRYYTSVMVLDCAKLTHWNYQAWLDRAVAHKPFYDSLMWVRPGAPHENDFAPIPSMWNDLDIRKQTTALLHFTGLHRQPWKYPGHPFGDVFREALKRAMVDRVIRKVDVEREVRARRVREDVLDRL